MATAVFLSYLKLPSGCGTRHKRHSRTRSVSSAMSTPVFFGSETAQSFGIPADPEQMVQHSKWLCKHKMLNGAKGSADEVELTRAGFAYLCWQRMQGRIPTGGLKEAILERMRVVLCEWCPHVQRREKLVIKVQQNLQKGIDVSQHLDAIKSAMESVVFHR